MFAERGTAAESPQPPTYDSRQSIRLLAEVKALPATRKFPDSVSCPKGLDLSILRANRQINREAMDVMLRCNQFVTYSVKPVFLFLLDVVVNAD